jgi:hypothetical protein
LYWPFGLDLPFSLPQQDSDLPTDKLVHGVLFAVPAYCGLRWAQVTGRAWIAAAVIAGLVTHAGLSEVVQGAVLARRRDAVDAMADAAGILIGAGWARYRAGR